VSSPEARIEALESKLAFQEDLIAQLNDALVGQQNRIDQLEVWLKVLAQQIRIGLDPGQPSDESPPPHY